SLCSADPNAWFAPREESGPIAIPRRARAQPPSLPDETAAATASSTPTPRPLRTNSPPPPPPFGAGMSSVRRPPSSPTQLTAVAPVPANAPDGEDDFNFEWAPVPAVPGMDR